MDGKCTPSQDDVISTGPHSISPKRTKKLRAEREKGAHPANGREAKTKHPDAENIKPHYLQAVHALHASHL